MPFMLPFKKMKIPHVTRTTRRTPSRRGNNWSWEVGALFLSVASLVALISILAQAQGKPVSQWTFIISFNGLISTLGAISRTSLAFALASCIGQAKWNWFRSRKGSLIGFERFDDASRGPWGAPWLIIWLRARHWVAIGSLVTILLAAFEPFLQTVVSLTDRTFELKANSDVSITRSEFLNYSTCSTKPLVFTPSTGSTNIFSALKTFDCTLEFGLQNARRGGLTNASSSLLPSTSCAGGNCTWTPFLSTEICGSCGDITNHLQRNIFPQANHGVLEYRLNDTKLDNYANSTGKDEGSKWIEQESIGPNQKLYLNHDRNTMFYAFQIIKAADSYEKGSTTWEETDVTAFECAFFACVNLYQVEMTNGLLKERVIETWSGRKEGSYTALDSLNSTKHDIMAAAQNDFPFDSGHKSFVSGQLDFTRRDLEIAVPEHDRIRYEVSAGTKFGLSQNVIFTIEQIFAEDESGSDGKGGTTLSRSPPYIADAENDGQELSCRPLNPDGTMADYLYHSTDVSETVSNIAKAVSVYISDTFGSKHPGKAHEWVICYEIQWVYLTVPVLTILLGIFFCAACMLQAQRLGLRPWKTDLIATLAHSADTQIRDDLRNADIVGLLSTAASNTIVRFEDGRDGPELRKTI
ncbi:hypothetical protein F4808DRAFT_472459 [Astrocystis sublimbata]|nr:hypothetical protein F4808DRAFT_472459 [Astrocystis sublimbata]